MATILEKSNAILADKNTNLLPENLKSGVKCLGVDGTLVGLQEGSADATATANDIVQGATAYVNGEKITGNVAEVTTDDIKGFAIGDNMVDPDKNDFWLKLPSPMTTLIRDGATISIRKSNVATAAELTPDKIVSGNTILGIEGTAEVGSSTTSGAKIFETAEEMNASTNNTDGDLAVVYGISLRNTTVDDKFQKATFPTTVTLPTAYSGLLELFYISVDGATSIRGELWDTGFEIEVNDSMVSYTSEDGITFTRDDSLGEEIDFGVEIYYETLDAWDDVIGYFVQIKTEKCEGVYKYDGTKNEYIQILS